MLILPIEEAHARMRLAAPVAHLSLLLGLKLESYVVSLDVAGILHDIGLRRLPEPLQQYCETNPPKDPADYEEWQTHARLGYELIRSKVEPTAAPTSKCWP